MSECPDRYKESTRKSMINGAYKTSSQDNFHHEICRLKQTFVNNGYSQKLLNQFKKRVSSSSQTSQQIISSLAFPLTDLCAQETPMGSVTEETFMVAVPEDFPAVSEDSPNPS